MTAGRGADTEPTGWLVQRPPFHRSVPQPAEACTLRLSPCWHGTQAHCEHPSPKPHHTGLQEGSPFGLRRAQGIQVRDTVNLLAHVLYT